MADDQNSEENEKGNRHPKTAYAAKYPYNRLEVTESGHEVHFDDTPGKERIRVAHKSGTYHEISPKGRKVEMVVDNHHQYIKGGDTRTVDKNSDFKTHGSHRQNVGGHSHTEIKGDSTTAIGKDSKTTVGGDSVTAVKGDQVHGVVGETHLKIGKNLEIKGDAEMKMKVDGKTQMEFGDELVIFSISNMRIISKTQVKIEVGDSHILILPGTIHIKAQDVRIGGGGEVNVQSGVNKVDPPWVPGAEPPE